MRTTDKTNYCASYIGAPHNRFNNGMPILAGCAEMATASENLGKRVKAATEHIRPGPPAACYHAELCKVLVKGFGQGMVKIDRLSKFIAKLPRLARNDASATLLSLRGAEGDEATSAHHDRARRTLSDSRFMLRTAL